MSFLDLSFSRPSVIVYRYVHAFFVKASGNIFQETFLGWVEQKSFLIGWILIIQTISNTLFVLQLTTRNLCFKFVTFSFMVTFIPALTDIRNTKNIPLAFHFCPEARSLYLQAVFITQLKSTYSVAFTVYQINCFRNDYRSIYFHPSFVSCSCWQKQSWWARSSKWEVESWMQIQQ